MTKVASNSKAASQLTTYTMHLSEAQLQTISHACEVLARLGVGQFKDALECLPTKTFAPEGWHDDMNGIASILQKHLRCRDEWRKGSQADECRTAWDLHQVARHRLAWDRNPEGDSMSVLFDQPHKTGPEPLAWVERTKE